MLLQIKKLSKRFGKMYALSDINFNIGEGEIHGLVGENGAGKSTLIKILTGVYMLDEGEIIWQSKNVNITNPQQSRDIGINVIHQDRHLIPSFNGVENAYLGIEHEKKYGYMVNYKKMREKVESIIEELGIEVPLDLPASKLTPPQRTLIEIIRAMMTDCKLLILDEPTASLTDKEANILFKLIKRLKAAGTSILYVTHRMDEIFELTDKVTVFRNGKMIKTLETNNVNKDGLVNLMSGDFASYERTTQYNFGEKILSVSNIKSSDGKVRNAIFDVRAGEILGIFGLGGSGRTELLECIYGLRASTGVVELYGDSYEKRTANKSISKGVVLICEDRRGKALVTSLSVKQNTVLTTIDNYSKYGVVDSKKEVFDTQNMIDSLSIKAEGVNQRVGELSGGNQQKVVFAKALLSEPNIILCDEPTQAVDVKTRAEIHKLLKAKAMEGKGIVFVSSDLKEVMDIADNILVMANGETREQFENSSLTAEDVLACCYIN